MSLIEELYLSVYADPTISVSVDADGAAPAVETMYSLTCNVTGAEVGLPGSTMICYRWFKDGEVLSDETSDTLSFTSLTFSHAGGYTCEATVMSSPSSSSINNAINSSNAINVTLTCKSVSIHLLVK